MKISRLSDLELLTREELEELAHDGGPDPFEALKDLGIAALLNFIHQKHGPEALAVTLRLLAKDEALGLNPKSLEKEAEELEALGLMAPARIIRETAEQIPPQTVADILKDENPLNRMKRLANAYRNGRLDLANLINTELFDTGTIEFIARSRGCLPSYLYAR